MTAPRQAMFQRKGGDAIPTDAPDTSAESQTATPMDVTVCPNCDCAFNPASGEILQVGGEQGEYAPDAEGSAVDASAVANLDPSTMPMPDGMFQA